MNAPWGPVIFVDITGSVLMLLIAICCAINSRLWANKKPDDIFRNYIYMLTLVIVIFAVSRSFGHLIKQILLLNDMGLIWHRISPFSGAVNSITFSVIFALGIYFHRFQKIHSEVEYYKDNLEIMIKARTEELEKSRNTLENILNNSNPMNITDVNFDLLQANDAYYALWPRDEENTGMTKCHESRPGSHCNTDECPLQQIIAGSEEVSNEVSKNIRGKAMEFIITARPFRDVDGKLIGMVESFQDITLRKQAERAMRESEERFRQIFESNPDPVVLARLKNGAIIDVNKAFVAKTRMSRLKVLGHNSEELGLWAGQGLREPFLQRLRHQGEVDNYEVDFKIKDSQIRTGLVSARILNVSNEPCILFVIRDITAEKAAERILIEMDRIKDEFISTAAHELNTPLSTMMGYTEFLRNPEEFGGFSEEQKQDFINEIYDRGEVLCRTIKDLLDISRIESGNPVPLDLQKIEITEVLRKSAKLFQPANPGNCLRLELPDKTVQPVLLIDRHRINQVLENLLSNAVKYSPAGQGIVLTGREKQDGWEIMVKDQGIGMTPEQLDRVFDKFYRADASNTAISGLGLGMGIAKQVIEAHGGSIRIESVVDQGTTVLFTLPSGRET